MQRRELDFSTGWAMAGLTLTGGFINAYTMVRWAFMATMNSGNISRLGVALGSHLNDFQWSYVLPWLTPILGTIVGSGIGTVLLAHEDKLVNGSAQMTILLAELVGFFLLGWFPDAPWLYSIIIWVAVFAGMQLVAFRNWGSVDHSTTICSGNIRNIGRFWGEFCDQPSWGRLSMAVRYTLMTGMWLLGAFGGAVLTLKVGGPSIWVCVLVMAVVLGGTWMRSEKAETVHI